MILMAKFTHQLGKKFSGEDLHPAGIGHLRGRPAKHHPLYLGLPLHLERVTMEVWISGQCVYSILAGSGGLVVRCQAPAGRCGMADFICGLSAEELPAARAQAIVPAIPAPEFLLTAQAGGGAGIGHTWSRCLVHRSGPHTGADAIKIKIDKYY